MYGKNLTFKTGSVDVLTIIAAIAFCESHYGRFEWRDRLEKARRKFLKAFFALDTFSFMELLVTESVRSLMLLRMRGRTPPQFLDTIVPVA